MIRLGLCCIFRDEPIKFRRTTAKHLMKFARKQQLMYLSEICRHNAEALGQALEFCHLNGIGDFRINSQILPLKTHPGVGYAISDLPDAEHIVSTFKKWGHFCHQHHIRTTFHPDQFILLSSPKKEVTERSIADLIYQAEVAGWLGADVINIHGGGAYGDKTGSLRRLALQIRKLPAEVRTRLTLENDDRVYTPSDLLPVCRDTDVPLVYDVHHHRCLPDGLGVEDTTEQAWTTWNREPLFHISTPLNGWEKGNPRPHHDHIDINDFPLAWLERDLTIEVEAKAKELAVLKLKAGIEALQVVRLRQA
jgi:UV DNA damage endonuclease